MRRRCFHAPSPHGNPTCFGEVTRWVGPGMNGPRLVRLCESHKLDFFRIHRTRWIKVGKRMSRQEAFRLVLVQETLEA